MFERFLDAWPMAPDEDSLIRAARLLAQGTRAAMLGWAELLDEQLADPLAGELLRGELEEFPDDIRLAFMKVTNLAPEMFLWLAARYLEHRSVNGIVEGFERFLATRGLAPVPGLRRPARDRLRGLVGLHAPHARTRRRVRRAARRSSLQRHADAASTRHGGRLVKLLG